MLGDVDWPLAAQLLAALGTLVLALLTFRYTRATVRLANQAERSGALAEQPWLTAYARCDDGGLYLVIENSGHAIAADCHVTADFDPKVHEHLSPAVIEGSELPGGRSVERFTADLVMGASRQAYTPIVVRCRWRWAEQDRSYERVYRVDPGLALSY